jgi:hypothetical protein
MQPQARSAVAQSAGTPFAWWRALGGQSAAEPEKVTAMSRKSVIQLIPVPSGCGDASDLRYRLLMAALGSSDEANPLLAVPDAVQESNTVAESSIGSDQDVRATEVRVVERVAVAELEGEGQAIQLSVVRAQAPSPTSARTATELPAQPGDAPMSRPPKRR